jgi:NAD(P)-dependent dehydrogenase (short-subunit alcohol dehydrogenase family)
MSVSYDFSGQTAIVTGGARGIGRAIVTQFVRSGAHVWIWDVDPIELQRVPHYLQRTRLTTAHNALYVI